MYLKLALKEKEKHWKLFLFIILQLSVTFIVAACCVSVLTRQYIQYRSYKPVMEKEGWFVHTNLGLRMPEADVGTGKTGKEVMEKYLRSAEVICSYSMFADVGRDDNVLDVESIVYDKELIEIMNPVMAEGRWLEKNNGSEIEAVVSQNYYGLQTGDLIQLIPYSEGEPDQVIPIRIVGVLDENAEIMKMNYSPHMINYRNFIFSLKDRWDTQFLIMQQEDFDRLSSEWSQLREVLWPRGLLFIQYDENITEEEREANDKFIEGNVEIAIKEPLAAVKEKSIFYAKEQVSEILPVFFVFLVMTVMSTICISILEVKQHVKNLSIYRIVGIDKRGCFRIQFLVNLVVLFEAVIVTALACLGIKKFRTDIIFLEFGIWQILSCMVIAVFWLGIAYIMQRGMLGDHELWRVRR